MKPTLMLEVDTGLDDFEPEELAYRAAECVDAYLANTGRHRALLAASLPAPWRMVDTLIVLDGQVNNGGFHQFFTNARGAYDTYLMADVELLGDDGFREIVGRAHASYSGMDYSEPWESIGTSWETFREGYADARFEAEDTAYYALNTNLPELIGRYICAHANEYIAPEEINPLGLTADGRLPASRHPLLRRLMWHPLVALCSFAYLGHAAVTRELTIVRIAGVCVATCWLLMAVYNSLSRHRLLDWLYQEE